MALDDSAPRAPHRGAHRGALEQLLDARGERRVVARRDEKSVLRLADKLRVPSRVGRDHGPRRGHSLENGIRHPLDPRGVHVDVGQGEKRRHIEAAAREQDSVPHAQDVGETNQVLPVSGSHEQEAALGVLREDAGERPDQHREILHGNEPSDARDHAVLRSQSELTTERLRIPVQREAVQIDPVRDEGHPLRGYVPTLDEQALEMRGHGGEARHLTCEKLLRPEAPHHGPVVLVAVLAVDQHRHPRELRRHDGVEEGRPVVGVDDVRPLAAEEPHELRYDRRVDPGPLPQHDDRYLRIDETPRIVRRELEAAEERREPGRVLAVHELGNPNFHAGDAEPVHDVDDAEGEAGRVQHERILAHLRDPGQPMCVRGRAGSRRLASPPEPPLTPRRAFRSIG